MSKGQTNNLVRTVKANALGLILLMCCWTLFCDAALEETDQIVDEWIKNYASVFTRQRPRLTPEGIVERMEFMHTTMDQVLGHEWISENMTKMVTLWYGAIMDKNASHCNPVYFDDLDYNLYSTTILRSPPTLNKEELFRLFHQNIGNFCRQVLADYLSSSISDQTTNVLKTIIVAHESWLEGKLSSKELAKSVIGQLKLQKSSTKEQIVASWQNGPCNELQQVIGMPDKLAIYALIRKDVLIKQSSSSPVQDTIDLFFGMGLVCDHLDSKIPDLANHYASGFKKSVSRLFGKQ